MSYLDFERLDKIDPSSFRTQKPYPWINPGGLLTDEGYRRLRKTLPDVSQLNPVFGARRLHGQPSHDRYTLEYSDDLDIADAWKEFADELKGQDYRGFLGRLLGSNAFDLNLHWHYTPNGCSVSPHCDSKRKLGSHIFYFNTEGDWDPSWGGETLVLDDGGRLDRKSAPSFDEFDRITPSKAIGNYSLLFAQTSHSWHGVREVQCPRDRLRKIFVVVINKRSPVTWLRRLFGYLPKSV